MSEDKTLVDYILEWIGVKKKLKEKFDNPTEITESEKPKKELLPNRIGVKTIPLDSEDVELIREKTIVTKPKAEPYEDQKIDTRRNRPKWA